MKNLNGLRSDIDKIDQKILFLIKKRFDIARRIGKYKKENNMPLKDSLREKEVLDDKLLNAQSLDLSPSFIKKFWTLIFEESYKIEK